MVNLYYNRFNQLGVKIIEPPIGKCEPHNVNLPQYKEIARNLDSLISKQKQDYIPNSSNLASRSFCLSLTSYSDSGMNILSSNGAL